MGKFHSSTYGQLTFMFGLLLLINFLVIMVSLRQLTFRPAATQFAMLINNQLNSVKPLLLNKKFKQAENLILQSFPNKNVTVSTKIEAQELPNLKFYQTLSQQLKRNQSDKLEILIQESEHNSKLWIKPLWLSDYWLGITFQPFLLKASRLFFFIAFALLLFSSMAAYFFSRYMLKPFKNLAKMAVDIVEQETTIKDIEISGTNEIREITQLVKDSAQQIHQLNKEKEMLLAGVSHDLRTPLARMRLQAEFLNDEESRNAMIQDVEEMDAIIGDFVAYVRSGSYEESQKLDIVAIIQETIAGYCSLGKTIEFTAPTDKIMLDIKPLCLKRMLTNIFDNAYKYGKPPVLLEIYESHTHLCLRVIDHGEGLDEEEIKTIFDPFVMAQSTDNQYGSGLGLSIVKKMAQQNNAQVSVTNHERGGLCVCVQFN